MSPSSSSRERFTQAVVLIHGMGEQKPMGTLRSFCQAVLPDPPQGGPKFFSKPDPLSASFELRKLQDRSQPRTHFFEYYWAYKAEGTKYRHVFSWLRTLLWRSPSSVPPRLRPLWLLTLLLLLGIVAAAVLGYFDFIGRFQAALSPFLWSLLSLAGFAMLQWALLYNIGDAARYLSPTPANIKMRQSIRADGVRLLQNLHASGEYQRVVVVGHSLGSVIAYDILTHYWQQVYVDYQAPKRSSQPELQDLETAGEMLRMSTVRNALGAYRDAQFDLWKEQRSLGNPWLVTDLITLGSPLAHAAILLAADAADLAARQEQRELPTAPPVPEIETTSKGEKRRYSFRLWEKLGPRKNIALRALHHAALFAETRWTNLYYPAWLGLFGDFVGGPLAPWFGPGLRDIPVRSRSRLRDAWIGCHSTYWKPDAAAPAGSPAPQRFALSALIEALDLDNEAYFK